MSSFYKCAFFEKPKLENVESFVVEQEELVMNEILDNNRISFSKNNVLYRCSFIKQDNFEPQKPTLLIPIKDNSNLLEYTINNLKQTKVTDRANVIIIDDRSEEDLKSITLSSDLSYLRVDNEKGFNFSMLNNIAAKLCSDMGVKEIVLWNSDLWTPDEHAFLKILERHRENNSKISGTKLVYPPVEMSLNKNLDTENIKTTFPNLTGGKWRETVQFGGDVWVLTPQSPIRVSPLHFRRFSKIENPLVNCDRGCNFVTGALQIWDLKFFVDLGGLNPSLSKNFQDVDVCLKATESGESVFYFGKNLFLYHDESLSMHSIKNEKKNDHQMISDHYLFAKLWNEKIGSMVF